MRPASWGFRASAGSAGWAGAHGLPSDPGWAARAQHPSLTPSITGDDEETEATGGRLSSDPEPGGPSEPSRSWPGNILQQTPCGKPKGQKDHGRDPAGGPCLLARPAPAAGFPAQPALCQLPEVISTMPCVSGSGFLVGPSHRLKLPLPSLETPSPVPQSSEHAAQPAATGGPSLLPEGPFQQLLTPHSSVLPNLRASLSSPIVQLRSLPLPVGGGGGEGASFYPNPCGETKAVISLCADMGLRTKARRPGQAPQDLRQDLAVA